MNKIAKTINIYLIAEMQRLDMNKSFDYMTYIEDRKIKIIPTGVDAQFTDVYLSSEFVTANNEEEFIKIFGINLTANIELNGTENDDYHVTVDELGQIIITLDVNLENTNSYGEFVEVIENKDIDLVEEAEKQLGEFVDKEAEEPDIESVTAEVLTEAELEDEEGPEWLITYSLDTTNESLTEAEETEAPEHTDTITAPDIETAVKYAEQNARVKAKEDSRWADAEVVSIKKKES